MSAVSSPELSAVRSASSAYVSLQTTARTLSCAAQSAGRGLSRRAFAVGGAAVGLVSLTGCSSIVNWIAGKVFDQVTVLNDTDTARSGTIRIVYDQGGENEETVLDESFDLPANPEDDDSDENSNFSTYGDVWTDTGEYTVSVSLDEGSAINRTDGESVTDAQETVTIDDMENQKVMAALGSGDVEEEIFIQRFEQLEDLETDINQSS